MLSSRLPPFVRENYEHREWHHASAILTSDFPDEWQDIMDVLSAYRLKRSYVSEQGGNKSKTALFIDQFLGGTKVGRGKKAKIEGGRGWRETRFDTAIVVDDDETPTPTHKIDMFKNSIALEVEWNNKDPFYDRDLNNFRLLYALRTVSVGVIVTRSDELQGLFNDLGRGKSYGNNTTHLSQLIPRIDGGGAGGCPVLIFGIKRSLFCEDD